MENEKLSVILNLDLEDGGSISAQINYYLVQSHCETEDFAQTVVYGIKAELVNSKYVIDSVEIQDITPSKEKCEAIISLLAKNTVTPATLKNVVDDLLASNFASVEVQTTTAEIA